MQSHKHSSPHTSIDRNGQGNVAQGGLLTCVRPREGTQNTGVLSGSIVHLHDIIERGLEEGELAEHHCRREMIASEVRHTRAGP